MSFPRYPEYKDSGVEWLGAVPRHWRVMRIKHLLKSLEQGWSPQCEAIPVDSPDEWGVLKVGCVNGGVFNAAENKALPPELEPIPDLGIRAADLLISRANTRELVGSAAVALIDHSNLMLCDKLFRLRFDASVCSPHFIASYLSTGKVRGQIELAASGASSSMLNIGQSTILEMAVALPDSTEQVAICDFLRRETTKIDNLMAEQEKLIALLKEKRQAVIAHAVTKGLNPTAPMKDSGVEWLGEVPAHWQVQRMANLFMEVVESGDDSLPVLSVSIHSGVSDKELNDSELDRKVTRSDDRGKYKKVQPSDLVYNMMRAWQGGFGSVTVPGQVSPAYVVARPITDFFTAFVEQALRTPQAVEEMRRHSQGVTDFRLRLYWQEFKCIQVALPDKGEQEAILAFIAAVNGKLEVLEAEAQHAIDLLKERRTALISAAVTGQIDVRGLVKDEQEQAA